MGFAEDQFKSFLAPNCSFKKNNTRGNKGVGATYLAYGFNQVQITRIKTTAKQKHGLRVQAVEMDTGMIKQIADEIAELSADISDFHRMPHS